jgi:hypothetical protein
VNIANNTGTIIQINNVAPPAVASALKAKAGRNKPWKNLLLPAHEPTPENRCTASIPKESLIVVLGGMGTAYCDHSPCPILTSHNGNSPDEDILSVSFDGSELRVHAEVFGPDGRLEVAIGKNELLRNRYNTLRWDHPDPHSLDVVDDRYRKSLSIRFINPHAIYIEGLFYSRAGRALNIQKDKGMIGGLTITGSCDGNNGLGAVAF